MKFLGTLSQIVRWSAGLWGLALVIALMLLFTAIPAAGAAPKISIEQPEGTPLGTGTVIAWGSNAYGQTNVPIGLTGVQAIEAGWNTTVALKSDDTVVAWGNNDYGQTNVPAGLTGVSAIAASWVHTVALKTDGTVVAWGFNGDGQTNVPAGLTGVQAIAAGWTHTVALKSNGTIVAWGWNYYGQTNVPAELTGVQAIAAGNAHTVALKTDGTVVAWGLNQSGETNVPVGLSGVKAIAAGQFHTVVVKSNYTVTGWGKNNFGQSSAPAGLAGVRAIACGESHTVALANFTLAVGFGTQAVGISSPAKTFTVKNIGTAALNITNVSVIGGNSSDFTVSTTDMLSSIPAATGVTTFTVTFTPGALGARSTTVRTLNNDTDEGTLDIVLTGTGVAAPTAPIINTQSLTVLGNGVFQLTFANPSNVTFSVLASTNLGLPLADWTVLGTATNIGGGIYQFGNPISPGFPQRFYRLRFP